MAYMHYFWLYVDMCGEYASYLDGVDTAYFWIVGYASIWVGYVYICVYAGSCK